jgi:TonB-dependent receptor
MKERDGKRRAPAVVRASIMTAAAAFVAVCAADAQAAQIRGRILNAETGRPAAGAQVKVAGSDATATTDADGRFTIANVPAGPQTVVVNGAGFRDQRADVTASDDTRVVDLRMRPVEQLERIVVSGIRTAELAGIAAKREAETQVEVVTADEVGKLVDKNVAEAVARLPGVTTYTDKGEGRYVVIRGLEPTLANMTINNQSSAAPEPESRQVKLDDVPAAMIGEVTVVKVLTADRDANAIAGQVDIKTLSAFDRSKNFASARLAGTKGTLYDDKGREGDITVGGTFGANREFGAVLSYSRSKRPSFSDDVIATGDVAWQVINGFEVPVSMDGRQYLPAFRTREGLVANFDWEINPSARAYLRFTGSKFDDNETRKRFRFLFPTSASGYANMTEDSGDITGARGERYLRERQEITETKTVTIGSNFTLGRDNLLVEASSTKATKEDPIRSEFRYRTGSTTIPGSYVINDTLFDLTLDDRAYDPARFNLNTFRDQFRMAKEDLRQARVDYQMARDSWGAGSFLKFGGKYLDRHKVNNASGTSWAYTGPTYSLANTTGGTIDSIYDRYRFGPWPDFSASRAYFEANPGYFEMDLENTLADSLATDYDVKEKIGAAYVMASIVAGNWTFTPGLRVERTKDDYKAIAVTDASTVNDTYNTFGSTSYTDWFPSFAAKLNVSKDLVARASITTAIGRPDYEKVVPSIQVSSSDNEVTRGNPNLKPLKAVNLDASLEYYIPRGGLASVAVFHKKIDDPIFFSTTVQSGTFAGVALTDATVTEPLNGDRSKVTGIEFNYQQPFSFLPSPWDGFGASVNLTFANGKTRVFGRSDELPMVLQADKLANLQLYYEKYGFTGRLAYTYHSEFLELVGATPRDDIYVDKNGVLSLKLGYDITKQFNIFFEANNLNNEEDYRYAATRNRMVEAERFGRMYRLGVSWSY